MRWSGPRACCGGAQADDQPDAVFVDHPEAIARDVLTGHGDVVARLNVGDGGGVPDGAADVDAQGGVNTTQAAGKGVVGGHD